MCIALLKAPPRHKERVRAGSKVGEPKARVQRRRNREIPSQAVIGDECIPALLGRVQGAFS